MLAPDLYRAFAGQAPLGDFQRYQLILAALDAGFHRVIGSLMPRASADS